MEKIRKLYADWANRSITVPETGIDTDDPSVPVPGVYYPIYVPSPGEVIDQKTQTGVPLRVPRFVSVYTALEK